MWHYKDYLVVLPALLVFVISSPTVIKGFTTPDDLTCLATTSKPREVLEAYCTAAEQWNPINPVTGRAGEPRYARARLLGPILAVNSGLILVIATLFVNRQAPSTEKELAKRIQNISKSNMDSVLIILGGLIGEVVILTVLVLASICLDRVFAGAWTGLSYGVALANLGKSTATRNDSMIMEYPR